MCILVCLGRLTTRFDGAAPRYMPEGDGVVAGLDSSTRDCTRANTRENGATVRKDSAEVDGAGAVGLCGSAAGEDSATSEDLPSTRFFQNTFRIFRSD